MMICPHCHNDVEGIWVEEEDPFGARIHVFVCQECNGELETEDSYEDYVSDMKADRHD